MISNRILQTTVDGLKAISRVDLCIVDADKNVAAKTFDNVSECLADAINFIDSPAESQAVNGFQFFKVEDDGNLEYIIMARGTSDDVYMVGKLAAFQIQNLLVAYKERFDKDNFIKNLLLDNLLRVDMYTRAEKLHIDTDVKRVVYIIETKHEKDINALETIRTLFASRTRDFITAVDEKSIILVREVTENIDEPNMGVPFLCDKLGMSRASLYNKLKALTGMGANDYINKLRIDNAINLLLNSSLTVNEIADRVGFSTPRYFSAVFKKNMGCSPTQYKEEQFKNNVQNI